jgi:hypothetical protein
MDNGKKMKRIPKIKLAMAMLLVFCGARDPGAPADSCDESPARGAFVSALCSPQLAQSMAPSGIA